MTYYGISLTVWVDTFYFNVVRGRVEIESGNDLFE